MLCLRALPNIKREFAHNDQVADKAHLIREFTVMTGAAGNNIRHPVEHVLDLLLNQNVMAAGTTGDLFKITVGRSNIMLRP